MQHKPTVTGTLSPGGTALPAVQWTDGVLITPLIPALAPFLAATRVPLWCPDAVPSWFVHQAAGDKTMYALWVPSAHWTARTAAYAAKHGAGRVYSIEHEAWLEYDLPAALAPFILAVGSETWRPAGTIAIDWANHEYDADAHFGGDVAAMQARYACRATRTVALAMLAVVPPLEGNGYARALLDFAESGWAWRVGFKGCEGWEAKGENVVKRITLATELANERNVKMYETKRGYARTGVAPMEWGEAVFFAKEYVDRVE
ncbi:hypothetical protein H9P43_002681 [Blastocladiella emersonii ATCC 22665]|nr:hypothetical protein H9P43_002681 [Blastocladiella emersonii ATCC 22665]